MSVETDPTKTGAGNESGDWTPTWTAFSGTPDIGNGTLTGRYVRTGRMVTATFQIVGGSSTNWGTNYWKFTLPFPARDAIWSGTAFMTETGVDYNDGSCFLAGVNELRIQHGANGNYVSNSYPFTWGSTDILTVTITYEADF